ncbi:MAG TPA: carbohydrate kinase [Pseudomonadota bacterium]|nr:carbohydrate kinase [Pseudomonadota bacterium]
MALLSHAGRPGAPPLAVDAVVFGEALVDFFPENPGTKLEDVERFVRHLGGAPCNLTIGLRRQGIPTALVTQVGSDAFGRFIKQKLDSEGVAVDGIASHKSARTGVTFVSVAATGERSFLFYRHPSADMLVTTAEVTPPLILRGRLFHFGSSSLSREPARAATLHALELVNKQRKQRIVSCDLNLRPHLWPDIKEAPPLLRRVLSGCDVVKLTDDELPILCGTESIEAGAQYVRGLGATMVVVTLGDRGAYFDSPQGTAYIAAESVPVVDQTGAGDAFTAGLLATLLVYLNGSGPDDLRERLKALPFDVLKRGCLHGTHLAARVCTALGATTALPHLPPPPPPLVKVSASSKKDF